MFGREYYLHPEILLDSFEKMNESYENKTEAKNDSVMLFVQKVYIKLFGVPEIGFQERFLYADKILTPLSKKIKKGKVFDAGSGIGAYTLWLADKFPKAAIAGCEIDKTKLYFCDNFKKEIKKQYIKFSYKDITKPVRNGDYSLIVNIDVLEHIRQYKVVLRNFHKLLAKKGYLFIHTPQPNQKRIFKQSEKWHHEDHVHEGFTPQQLTTVLSDMGFRIVTIQETFGFFGKVAWEIDHILLARSVALAALSYPFLFLLARIDSLYSHKGGWGTAILAQKVS